MQDKTTNGYVPPPLSKATDSEYWLLAITSGKSAVAIGTSHRPSCWLLWEQGTGLDGPLVWSSRTILMSLCYNEMGPQSWKIQELWDTWRSRCLYPESRNGGKIRFHSYIKVNQLLGITGGKSTVGLRFCLRFSTSRAKCSLPASLPVPWKSSQVTHTHPTGHTCQWSSVCTPNTSTWPDYVFELWSRLMLA